MTLQWITTPPACQNLRFSIRNMFGILVRRTSIPLRYLQLELRASPHVLIAEGKFHTSAQESGNGDQGLLQ